MHQLVVSLVHLVPIPACSPNEQHNTRLLAKSSIACGATQQSKIKSLTCSKNWGKTWSWMIHQHLAMRSHSQWNTNLCMDFWICNSALKSQQCFDVDWQIKSRLTNHSKCKQMRLWWENKPLFPAVLCLTLLPLVNRCQWFSLSPRFKQQGKWWKLHTALISHHVAHGAWHSTASFNWVHFANDHHRAWSLKHCHNTTFVIKDIVCPCMSIAQFIDSISGLLNCFDNAASVSEKKNSSVWASGEFEATCDSDIPNMWCCTGQKHLLVSDSCAGATHSRSIEKVSF